MCQAARLAFVLVAHVVAQADQPGLWGNHMNRFHHKEV